MSIPSKALKVLTSDGKVFEISHQAAHQMGLTRNWLLQECGAGRSSHSKAENAEDDDVWPLDRVSSPIFELVLKWCSAVENVDNIEEKEAQLDTLKPILIQANANYETIFELIAAADFLNIENLLQAGTQYVADVITTCESVAEIRQRFNILCDDEYDENF